MRDHQKAVALACLRGAEDNSIGFPESCTRLFQAGIERYAVDFARSTRTYYLPDGTSATFDTHKTESPIGEAFDVAAIKAAIREAQANGPDYTYAEFCEKAVRAGCAGYLVSFSGRRAVYSGRTGETHVEQFPR